MKRIGLILILLSAAIAAVAGAYLVATPSTGSVEFTVRDAVSESWVYDLRITLADRVIHSYFQSDRGTVPMRFSRLERGEYLLEFSAPSYLPVRVPVQVGRGTTVLENPVEMTGFEIPDLTGFLVFETETPESFIAELRPVRSDGTAAINHPCLDIWIGCIVSVQTRFGAPATEATDSGSERGRPLFRGTLDWSWDPDLETPFRYRARVPKTKIRADPAPLLVFDYLVVVPDPRKTTQSEFAELMEGVWRTPSPQEAYALLERYSDTLSYYVDTSWNVERSR